MIPLKQSTASQEIVLGHFVDDADGKTAETGLTVANTDIKVWKAGATTLANKNSGGATHISGGIYYAVLDATDTDTLGALVIFVAVAGALAVRLECVVMPANVYDSLYGTDLLDVSLVQIAGDAQSGTDLKDFADAGYDPATNKVEGVKLADTLTTYTGNTPQTGDNFARIGAAGVGLTAVAVATGGIAAASFAAGAINAAAIATGAIDADALAADAVTEIAAGISIPSAAVIADAVWDEDATGHQTQGSFGQAIGDPVADADTIWGLANTNLNATVSSRASQASLDTVDGIVDDILLDTAEIGAAGAGLTAINLPNQTMDIVGNITGNLSGSVGSVTGAVGSVTGAVGSVGAGGITAASFAADAITAAKLAADVTTELQSGLATAANLATLAGYVDTEVAAILTTLGTPAGASLAADIAAIEAQTDDIGVAGAGLTAVPWNAAWDAEVQSEVQDAIEVNHLDHLLAVTYDPASKPGAADALLNELVESDAGVARYTANALEQAPTGGSAPTAAAIADAVWEEALVDHEGTAGSVAEALADAGGSGASAADIADAVWDEATAGHTTGGTFGEQVKTDVDAILADTGTDGVALANDAITAAKVAADVGTEIAAAVRTNLTTELGRIDAAVTTRASQASLDTLDDLVDTEVAAIKAKTDALPSDPADQSLIIAATDAIVTAVGTRASQTSVDDVPTNAELATALGTADDAILAAITALNNLSTAQLAAALATYDGPTKAEMDAAVALLATAANLALVKAKTDSLTFTVAGSVDSNLQRVNDVALVGSGVLGDEWGPA